jgi:hypothetical protein
MGLSRSESDAVNEGCDDDRGRESGGLEMAQSERKRRFGQQKGTSAYPPATFIGSQKNFLWTARPSLFWFENLWERRFKEVARGY